MPPPPLDEAGAGGRATEVERGGGGSEEKGGGGKDIQAEGFGDASAPSFKFELLASLTLASGNLGVYRGRKCGGEG